MEMAKFEKKIFFCKNIFYTRLRWFLPFFEKKKVKAGVGRLFFSANGHKNLYHNVIQVV